jgi:hypothetical protein
LSFSQSSSVASLRVSPLEQSNEDKRRPNRLKKNPITVYG